MPRRSGRASTELTRLVLDTYGRVCLLRLPGCTVVATTKDHIIPVDAGGTDDLDNMQPACRACNSKRRNLALGSITGHGARVVVVMGPPAGGKSTHVREHARPMDVTIDLDALARALMPNPPEQTHVYPRHVRHIAIGARAAAIQRAIRSPLAITVWLIHGHPSPDQVAEYRGYRYEMVTLDPGRDVAMMRARAERPPHVLEVVERWYAALDGGAFDATEPEAPAKTIALSHAVTAAPAVSRSRDW